MANKLLVSMTIQTYMCTAHSYIHIYKSISKYEEIKIFLLNHKVLKPTLRKFERKLDKFFPTEIRLSIKVWVSVCVCAISTYARHQTPTNAKNSQCYCFKSTVPANLVGFSIILRKTYSFFLSIYIYILFFYFAFFLVCSWCVDIYMYT